MPTEDGAAKPISGTANLVIPAMTLKAYGSTRVNLSVQNLMAASLFAREVVAVEQANLGQPFGPFCDELIARSSACILLGVASLEAYANELFIDAQQNFPTQAIPIIEAERATIEWLPVLEKFDRALELRNAARFDRGTSSYQDGAGLIVLRNALTHFRAEWSHERDFHERVSQRLNRRFDRSPFASADAPLFPNAWFSAGCVRWVVRTCLAFATEFATRAGLPQRFAKHATRIEL